MYAPADSFGRITEETIRSEAKSTAWADPDTEDIRDLLDLSSEIGWRRALDTIQERAPTFVQRMRNFSLGNWQVLLAPPAGSNLLDIGCGFGTLSLGSSVFAGTALGVDFLRERLSYAALRARQSGFTNAKFVRGDAFTLPLCSDAFQLVTLNGVLEWAGLFGDGDPHRLQTKMLEEAGRLVNPKGAVCVAIENSVAAETLLGLRDTHTGTHFLTAVPEPLSSILLKVRMGRDPRVRLHSRNGYERLFRDAGLSPGPVMSLIPSYNNYRFVIDTNDHSSHRFVYDRFETGEFYRPARKLRKILVKHYPKLLARLVYSYLVVGRPTPGPTLLSPDAPLWKTLEAPAECSRFGIQLGAPGSIGVLLHRDGVPHSLLKCWSPATGEPGLPRDIRKHLGRPCTEPVSLSVSGSFQGAYYRLSA